MLYTFRHVGSGLKGNVNDCPLFVTPPNTGMYFLLHCIMPSMHYHDFAIFKSEPLFLIKKTPALPEWILI